MIHTLYLAFALLIAPSLTLAKDDGRYAQSPLKSWFDSLRSGKGPCCSDADGEETEYQIRNGRYWIPVEGVMIEVPDAALLTQPNRFGRPMKWLFMENGKKAIRCFIPGAGG